MTGLPTPTILDFSSPTTPTGNKNMYIPSITQDHLLYPKSPPIVLSVLQYHKLLDHVKFEAKESISFIAKLLVRLHANFEEYRIMDYIYFYPCVNTTLFEIIASCSNYIVRKREILKKQALCIKCVSVK